MKKKILFIQMHVPDPRTNKRISVAKTVGDTSVICVRRYSQDIWEPFHKDVPHYIYNLDIPTSKHLVKRYLGQRDYNKKAYKKISEEHPDIIYCGGLDMLSLVCKYKKNNPSCKIFFEVADLREGFIVPPKTLKEKIERVLLSIVEKKAFPFVDYLALTSMKFYDAHYYRLISKNKVIYTPNVPNTEVFKNYKHEKQEKFTIGFIGGIRYLGQMKMLVDAAAVTNCNVIFAGAGGTSSEYQEITKYCLNKEWVKFTGKYDYDSQISGLYGGVDCVYAVYDASNPNVRIALPNKLYESVYCELPIIVSKNTYLSDVVESFGIGVSIRYDSKSELIESLNKLKNQEFYESIQSKCKLAKNDLINNTWIIELEKRFKGEL